MKQTQQTYSIALIVLFCLGCFAQDAAAKTKRTYYTAAEIAAIRQRASEPRYQDDVKATLKAAAIIADLSDEEIWNLVPPADLTRALTVRYQLDCPVHGAEIYKVAGRFPWITSSKAPFKVECPLGHEVYPSNDFDAYLKGGRREKLDTHQKYVDDGNGYIDADGNRYFFAGYYNFWHLWRKTLIDGTTACGNAFLLTGDAKYAHKAAVALASISRVYPKMDYSTQAYHNGKWPAGINGRVLDYIWENQTVGALSVAYDQIYPTLEDDNTLKTLAAAKNVPDVKLAIERDILQQMAGDLLAKKIWGNKFELRSTAALALILDNHDAATGITTEQMVDWLLRGGGDMEFTFYNGFDRDGWGGESSLSYSNIWNVATVAAAEDLSRLGVDLVKDQKWKRLVKAGFETRLLDSLSPRLGDTDGHIKSRKLIVNDELLMFGVSHFQDADCAAQLLKKGNFKPPLLSRSTVNESKLKELAADARFPDAPYTRDLGGYGLAILEINDGDQTHCATMYYGSPMASHGHSDRLTMSYHIGDRDIFPDLGYQAQWGPAADWWAKNTISHYCVMIDEQPQPTRYAGELTRFADLKGLKFAEAQAARIWTNPPPPVPVPVGSIGGEVKKDPPATAPSASPVYIPQVTDYRRMLALLDTGERSTLLIEASFVSGGKQHDYSFHGLPYGEFSAGDASIIKQQSTGTLAGENVEWGVDSGKGRGASGFQFLSKPRWYQPTDALHFSWRNDEGLNQDTWFPRIGFDEVIVADGMPPVYPGWPTTMPFILLRHQSESAGLQSVFLSVTDARKKDSAVQSVRPIKADQSSAGGAVIELKSGKVWKIYVNGSTGVARFEDQTESSVAFAAIAYDAGKPAKMNLIGAGSIQSKDFAKLTQNDSPAMQIKQVDYRNNSVVVSASDAPKQLAPSGLVLIAGREHGMAASYMARTMKTVSDGVELSFGDISLLTGRFEAGWDDAKKKIVSKERTGGVYNQFMAKSFIGMSVVSEDLSTTAAITGYDANENSFTIDADAATAARFTDANGDGRTYVYIADLAPGVTIRPTPASVTDLSGERK